MLAVYLVTVTPVVTGIPLHEYLGLGAFVVIAAHVAVSAAGLAGRGRPGCLALNAVLLLALAVTVVSGIMVSGDVLTALGETAPASDFAAMAALTAKTGAEAPASLSELDKLEVRFKTVLQPADIRTASLR